MVSLMLYLKDVEVNLEAIPVNFHQRKDTKKYKEDKSKKTIVVVHAGKLTKLQPYVSPKRKSRGRPLQSIMNLVTLRVFNMGQRKNLLTPNR